MLRERLIELLDSDAGILDMEQVARSLSWNRSTYDLSGLILMLSGYTLQIDKSSPNGYRLPLNAPHIDKKWIEYEASLGVEEGRIEIPALSRQIWEEHYGEKEAKQLPFYDHETGNVAEEVWWDDVDDVEAYQLISYLQGNDPHNINRHCD